MNEDVTQSATRRISVSSWSLHRTLGRPPCYGPAGPAPGWSAPADAVALLDLPAKLAAAEIHTLELCHFHLPSREASYLDELNAALSAAHVELWSFLVDGGDVIHPETGDRDAQWILDWLDVAAALGAQTVRVVAGMAPPTANRLDRAQQALTVLADAAEDRDLRLLTENWHALLSTPQAVTQLMDGLAGHVGFCCDFGNWTGATKYEDLAAIAAYADSCHAKCRFDDAGPDRDDFRRCLEIVDRAGFNGPYTLIYDGPSDDEWGNIATERAMVEPYLRM